MSTSVYFLALLGLAALSTAFAQTPNQRFDDIVTKTLANFGTANFVPSKNLGTKSATTDLDVGGGQKITFTLNLTKGKLTGLDSIRRSKSAILNAANTTLNGTFCCENLIATFDCNSNIPAFGASPGLSSSGIASVKIDKVFVNTLTNLSANGLPNNIAGFNVSFGNVPMSGVTVSNLNGNSYLPMVRTAVRALLQQIVKDTFNSNVKVQWNQAIQALSIG